MALEQVEECIPSLQESLEAGEEVTVWLHWVGEPLIHPEIKTILRRLASLGDRLHLFLVTNGLALDRDTTEFLLSLPGQHSLSISLNAISESVFQEVNGSPKRDLVYKNAHYFLEQRKSVGAEEEWSVLVTSVVLAKNLAELPSFVEYWRREFEQLGYAPSVVANGGFAKTAEQIHLLREIDLPESSILFREALRQVGHKDPEWDLEATRELDVWFLEAHKALNWIGNPDDWPEIDWQIQIAMWARGRASLHSGDLLGARRDLGSLARNPPPSNFPTYLALYHSLTGLSLAEGDLEQAKEYAKIALKADPADPYNQQLQRFADLLAHLMSQRETGPAQGPSDFEFSPFVLMFVKKGMQLAYQEGNPEQALQLGLRLLGVAPGEFIAQIAEVGFCFHRHKDYRRSIQFSDAVLERDPDCAYAHWLKAAGLTKMNRASQALPLLKKCLERIDSAGPEGFEDAVHDTLAEVYLALDEPEQSRLHASKALHLRPERVETRRQLPPTVSSA
jgi:tetratricopeptide (TPR) repeat protein